MKHGDKIKVIASIPKAGQVNSIDHLIGQTFTILRVDRDDGGVSAELPRDWQIFRDANSGGQWSDWKLNTYGQNLSSHDYRECVHVRAVLKGDDSLHTRLKAVEKERDDFHQCLLNREESLKRSGEDWVKAKEETDRVKLELAKVEKANGELVDALKQCSDLLRAVRYSMDRDVPFPSIEKINVGIDTAEAMKGGG